MAAMQTEFHSILAQKEAEITALRQRNTELETECHSIQASKRAQEEENKLLKRAVTIQDTRQRELATQNEQLQCVLAQAAQQINLLNQTNRQLKEMVDNAYNSSGGGNFDYRPPDVY
jgi:predicted RNase H-like nuclease (RuvC/YqgF family)